jgi:hypothetical protein
MVRAMGRHREPLEGPSSEEGTTGPERPFAFDNERHLQDLIVSNPSLLREVNEGPLAVAEEVSVPHDGPADVVAVDRRGRITIVECKRAVNPDGRWAVGQAVAYAAGLWKLDYESFKQRFERAARAGAARAEREGLSPRGVSLPAPFVDEPGWTKEAFRDDLSRTLREGPFQLLIAADQVGERLQRAVTFLNAQMPEVRCLACALDDAGDVRKVFGRSSGEVGPIRPRWKRRRRDLMDAIPSADAARAAAGLLKWADRQGPHISFAYDRDSQRAVVRARHIGNLFTIEGERDVRVSFSPIGKDEEWIRELRKNLEAIDPRFQGGKRPRAPLEALVEEYKRERFLALIAQNLSARERPQK